MAINFNRGYELRVNVALLKKILFKDSNYQISRFLNDSMANNEYLASLHKDVGVKLYSFSGLFKKSKVYDEGEMYYFYVRTYDLKMIEAFRNVLIGFENELFVCLDVDIKEIKIFKQIEYLKTISPTSLRVETKEKKKQWDAEHGEEVLWSILNTNVIKKYNKLNDTNIKFEAKDIFSEVKINGYETMTYKEIKQVGTYITVYFKDNSIAQDISKMAYFLGLGKSNSSLGFGFTIAKYKY